MPIGSAKIGVLGAGLVPGGTQTFNASGTFTVPPGVKKVNITGKGGSGNPGNAGNAGNSGNFGGGGSGGGGSRATCGGAGGFGGAVFLNSPITSGICVSVNSYPANIRRGGIGGFRPQLPSPLPRSGGAGDAGSTGTAGQAGQAGQAGNTGQTSSGLTKCFPGGAGGNAGGAGNAGNGGTGGNGGGGGIAGPGGLGIHQGGAGGNGGGAGANGPTGNIPYPAAAGGPQIGWAGGGGGGAGVTNNGQTGLGLPGTPPCLFPPPNPGAGSCSFVLLAAAGGTTCGFSVGGGPGGPFGTQTPKYPAGIPNASTGGAGGASRSLNQGTLGGPQFCTNPSYGYGVAINGGSGGSRYRAGCNTPNCLVNTINPTNPALRSGSGGGSGGAGGGPFNCNNNSAGGGGGGRGNAGNAGAAGNAGGSGSAATPSTFNCVPVTPGSPYPIVVGSPGGQVVISWNPQ